MSHTTKTALQELRKQRNTGKTWAQLAQWSGLAASTMMALHDGTTDRHRKRTWHKLVVWADKYHPIVATHPQQVIERGAAQIRAKVEPHLIDIGKSLTAAAMQHQPDLLEDGLAPILAAREKSLKEANVLIELRGKTIARLESETVNLRAALFDALRESLKGKV